MLRRPELATMVDQLDPAPTLSLAQLGFKPLFASEWLALHPDSTPWRVSQVHRGALTILGESGERMLSLSRELDPSRFTVGDWVLLQGDSLLATLSRSTWLRRRAVSNSAAQLIAANVDVVFIVCAYAETEKLQARNLNVRRIERYLHAAREGGVLPVVVVNKSDLSERAAETANELGRALSHPHVVTTSAEAGDIEVLKHWIGAGDTVALLGPSGVGKSSLINQLLEQTVAAVGHVRYADNKGRHTTTRRELVALPGGGLLIDTPGMRQFAIFSDEHSHASAFTDIDGLAAQCRFGDCTHNEQPGCAVVAAVRCGELSAARLESYQALRREALRVSARNDAYSRHLQNKKQRELGRRVKAALRQKGR